MKNKGFTLIELLAVIVILAIIALIATPIVLSIIEDSKNSANQRSSEYYLDAVENAMIKEYMNNPNYKIKDGSYEITEEGNVCLASNESGCSETLKVDVENAPTSGQVVIKDEEVYIYYLEFNGEIAQNTIATPYECFEVEDGAIVDYSCAPYLDLDEPNRGEINNITDVVIPSEINGEKITSIASKAFRSNGITSLVISNGVTRIGTSAFEDNPELVSIVFSNTITHIEENAFSSCGVNKIQLPNNLEYVEDYAFDSPTITSIEIPSSVKDIGIQAFGQNSLTSVVIYGKTSLDQFLDEYESSSAFSWAAGYSNDNIIWK